MWEGVCVCVCVCVYVKCMLSVCVCICVYVCEREGICRTGSKTCFKETLVKAPLVEMRTMEKQARQQAFDYRGVCRRRRRQSRPLPLGCPYQEQRKKVYHTKPIWKKSNSTNYASSVSSLMHEQA